MASRYAKLRGFRFIRGSSVPVPYMKPPLSYSDQVELLCQRGLIIPDKQVAERFFSNVNYYRFYSYSIPFELSGNTFRQDTTFDRIAWFYDFDCRLRQAVFCAISHVEVVLRTRIAYELCLASLDPFVHYNPTFFTEFFRGKNKDKENKHQKWIQALEEDTIKSNEHWINQYKKTYTDYPRIPLWHAVEIITFGALSKFYRGLDIPYKELIARQLRVTPEILASWMHCLTEVRNVCAHHGRLWNRKFVNKPSLPIDWTTNNERIFAILALLEHSCRAFGIDLSIMDDVYAVLNELRQHEPSFVIRAGIPQDWTGSRIWPKHP
jgi:abortive infection bacteriophage resistance protein